MISGLTAFFASLGATLVVIRQGRKHQAMLDQDLSGPQKMHDRPVPRTGGVGVFVGFVAGLGVLWWLGRPAAPLGTLLLLCGLPAFAAGLWEDLTKRVRPRWRLLATAVSAALAALGLGAVVTHTDIPGIDEVAATAVGSVALAMLVVSGVAHSVNIIDGFNGLASMCMAMMLAALAYVGFEVGDVPIATLAMVGVGAVLGFFVWNFPAGLVFLGDGGAYFLGFLYAELAILLIVRNPGELSPLFALLVCVYPVFETLFSIYRRRVLRGASPSEPDAIHLHTLVYRRIIRWALPGKEGRALTRSNSMTSPFMWLLCSLSVFPAIAFWDDPTALAVMLGVFVVTYISIYWRIVRFGVPRWFRRTRRRPDR